MHITKSSTSTPRSGSGGSIASKRRASKYILDEVLGLSRKEFAEYKSQAERMVTFNEVFIETVRNETEADKRTSAEAHEKHFKLLEASVTLFSKMANSVASSNDSHHKQISLPPK